MTEEIRKGGTEAPARIRVAQDVDGFWTCREAVSGSQEYIRADIVEEMRAALKLIADIRLSSPAEFREIARAALSRLAEVSNNG